MKIELECQQFEDEILKWAQAHPRPDDPVVVLPDLRVQGISPRALANEIKTQTAFGKQWLAGLVETCVEMELNRILCTRPPEVEAAKRTA